MRNPEERKKLLEQIAELERNSINYFDVEKEFFLITSDNLHMVRPRLYGYSIQRDGIYEDDNLTEAAVAGLDGRGCYVYVDVRDGKITIKQDINGCWGIYIFRHGDYFALSNSFFRLLDHVKFCYPLTVNRDYCHEYLISDACSHSFETAVNEIQTIERNAIVQIDITKKNLEIRLIDYKEHRVPLDSEEGIAVLDRWVEFWSCVLRGIAQHTKFIEADLSGGFDTRISLLLLLKSGVDLDKVSIHSAISNHPVYKEDYEIACKIAEHYDLKLNQALPPRRFLRRSMSDIWNMEVYSRMTFHKLPGSTNNISKSADKLYSLSGMGGELIRGNWLRFGSWGKFITRQIGYTTSYSQILSDELSISVKNNLDYASNVICTKYNINDKNSEYISQYLYQDVRARNHCGKINLISYFRGKIPLSPAFDSEIQTLRLNASECSDQKLLIALIFTRYASDLLKFPFQGGRSISPETIAYAQEINEMFPLCPKNEKNLNGGAISSATA